MIGLILKDLISLKKSSGKIIIIVALYIVIFESAGSITFLSAMIIIIFTMFILNTFAFDEVSKWDYYALSLPVTKHQIVLSKYLLTLAFDLVGILIAFLLFLVKNQVTAETVLSLFVLSALALIMASVMLPLLYKLGTQKARIWTIMILLLPTAGLMLLSALGIKLSGNILASISDSAVELLVYLAAPAALLLFTGSYVLSCKIFENKEI